MGSKRSFHPFYLTAVVGKWLKSWKASGSLNNAGAPDIEHGLAYYSLSSAVRSVRRSF